MEKNDIMQAQILAGELAVIERLKKKGLIPIEEKETIKDEWISVKNRLPSHNRKVYVWHQDNGILQDYYIDGWALNKQNEITYWREKNSINPPTQRYGKE